MFKPCLSWIRLWPISATVQLFGRRTVDWRPVIGCSRDDAVHTTDLRLRSASGLRHRWLHFEKK